MSGSTALADTLSAETGHRRISTRNAVTAAVAVEADCAHYWYDIDGDSYGGTYLGMLCSNPGAGTTTTPGDCDDGSTAHYPGAPELCDAEDNDCDGLVDDDLPVIDYYDDADSDGCGGGYAGALCADPGAGFVTNSLDCDDVDPSLCLSCTCDDPQDSDSDGSPNCFDCAPADASVFPGATEICDFIDQNCDGRVDEGLPQAPYWLDTDGDGFGGGTATMFCGHPGAPWVTAGGDCNDASPDTYPGAPELCDGFDNDCNFIPDDGLTGCPAEVPALPWFTAALLQMVLAALGAGFLRRRRRS